MSNIRVVIVDDERAARKELLRSLADYPVFEVVGEASNADEAESLIKSLRPELVFLDIQMPARSGFDLLASLDEVPQVIFVTAYDQYALQAFEFNAFDYLMKPIRKERLEKSLSKAQAQLAKSPLRKLFIKDGNKCYFLAPMDIHLIDSMDNYARVFFSGQRAIVRSSLNQLETRFEAAGFFRANRMQLVNVNYIKTMRWAGSKMYAELTAGETIEFSERQSAKFKQKNKF